MKYPKHHHNKPSILQAANIISANFVSLKFRRAALYIGTLPANQVLMLALKHHFLLK